MNSPSFMRRKLFMGVSVGAAIFFIILGIILWGGFNTALELTNTEQFCISCHEMEDNVYQEYKTTIHYANRSGVRATCPDCHVPREWIYKMKRKIQASNEIYHKLLGTINTREKFLSERIHLAKNEWKRMKASDSRECRNCHDFESMSIAYQKPRARKQHQFALNNGNTCIDCHKGIAHHMPEGLDEEWLEEFSAPDPSHAKPDAKLKAPVNAKQEKIYALSLNPPKPKVITKTVIKEVPAQCDATDGDAADVAPGATPQASAAVSKGFGIDWSDVPDRQITIFYPGQASMEWIFKGSEHGGKRPFQGGETCVSCHDAETADMGQKIVTGEKLEPTPIPGKRGSIAVKVQAAHDDDYLYMRYEWQDTEHAPVPFVDGGKMDPDNQVKLALMITTDDTLYADRAGCWGTCHHDNRDMPNAPEQAAIDAYGQKDQVDMSNGITKYITESRTKVEIKGRRGKILGGWDKLKTPEEVKLELSEGRFMDLYRYQIGTDKSENGLILAERKLSEGGVEFKANKQGDTWVVEMKRKLQSGVADDIPLDTSKVYNLGFAIHDDYTIGRFHHVSLGYKLGFDNSEAEINAVKKQASAVSSAPAAKAAPKAANSEAGSGLDWSKAASRDVTLFYPGQASMEWIFKGSEHGGKRPFMAGETCVSCHDAETADMGEKIVTGEKLEPTPIPGKRGSIPVTVQTMHDDSKLYMRFQWPDTEHTPVPFAEGGKMDPDNQVKLAVMFATDDVLYADRAGCWGTCHHDNRDMPNAPEQSVIDAYDQKAQLNSDHGVTKYITESRTKVEIKGRRGKKLGGWDKLKTADEVAEEGAQGRFMDVHRYKAGSKISENGAILADRMMSGGQDVEFNATLADGTWTVEMVRELKSDQATDLTLELDKVYNFGFAIHDDYTIGRFHHVSLGYKLGFDNTEVELNATAK
ncbi:NapC/NirT family cytochrome c [sulfur-oxidizing endosymbiont of Gigantopelta aegis]|uniref:NapC/NirT family cytochrome c n=1 Tax=sulfur-oxidizing endosymbiont of Gigantopelta aegis TaxID=2794934 RepID=UPI0018DD2440|nr:NapC/NirT family cytochrome c [sulfur-oxidizing endosymbiont of Gigantopelta aegis]